MSSVVSSSAASPTAGAASAERFPQIDRLRGLLALWVVIHHAAMNSTYSGFGVPGHPLLGGWGILKQGGLAVAAFLTVSGYSLAIGLFPKDRWKGAGVYFARRVRRIAPTYYAMLLLGTVLGLTVLSGKVGSHWDNSLPVDLPGTIAHILMAHNLTPYLYKIDYPMWSIATEFQAYLLLPLFVFLWRRYGLGAAFAAGFLLPLLAFLGSSRGAILTGSSQGMLHLGLFFMLGVLARWWQTRATLGGGGMRRGILKAAAVGLAGVPLAFSTGTLERYQLVWTGFAALSAAAWLVGATRPDADGEARGFDPLAWLGAFSYTLYLAHAFFVEAVWRFVVGPHFEGARLRIGASIGLGTAASVIGSYGLYLLVERRFLRAGAADRKSVAPFGNVIIGG